MAEPLLATSVFDRLLKDRIIWLGSEVRDDNANEIAAKLLLLAAEDPKFASQMQGSGLAAANRSNPC